jgi:type IV secretory pathway protease TraF
MRSNEKGSIGELVVALFGFLFVVAIIGSIVLLPFLKWQKSEELVSGIVYNNTNDGWPVGNTKFSVRASTDTYVSEENQSTYCLPSNSPYISLVKKAAADKNIKVVVTKKKVFTLAMPWSCINNVEVTREASH